LEPCRYLVFNDYKGLITGLTGYKNSVSINTGTVTHNNNDHVLSFDGNRLGLSSNVQNLGGSIIYMITGDPNRLPQGTVLSAGWSPTEITRFCGGETENLMYIKFHPVAKIRLTNSKPG
jgi:hypothetical protein